MNGKQLNPTDAELEILHILWKYSEARVKEVHEALNLSKNVGYTTILKLMQIMHEKGLLERRAEGKSHVYIPLVKKEEIEERFLDKMLHSVYKGSAFKMVMSALGNHKTSESELEKIKNLIDEQQKKRKS